MTPTTVAFATFATKYSNEALATRRKLPQAVQIELIEITDKLTEDPDAMSEYCRPISRDGKIRVYIHPDPHIEVTYEVDKDNEIIYFLHFAAPQMQLPRPLFISYSHQDREWLDRLKKWLQPLEKAGMVNIWDDSRLIPGSQWAVEIEQALAKAKVALLLVSQNFLTSEFITTKELPTLLDAAKKRGLLVLWLPVSSSTVFETTIPTYQALLDPKRPLDMVDKGEQNQILLSVYEKIKTSLETIH